MLNTNEICMLVSGNTYETDAKKWVAGAQYVPAGNALHAACCYSTSESACLDLAA